MISFGDYNLIPTALDECFGHFSRAQFMDDKTILLSEGSHVTATLNVESFTPLRSWTFPHISPLSSPVVYDHINQKYLAVHRNSILKIFTETDDEQDKFKFRSKISCVVANPVGESLVVFSNGDVKHLTDAVECKKEDLGKGHLDGEELLYAKVLRQSTATAIHLCFITTTVKDKTKSQYKKVILDTTTGNNTISSFVFHTYSALDVSDSGVLIGLAADGKIIMHVDDSTSEFMPSSKIGNIHFLSGSDNLIAFTAEIARDKHILTVMDWKYKVPQDLNIDCKPLSNGIYSFKSKLFLLTDKGLLVAPYNLKSLTLSKIIGSGKIIKSPHDNFLERLPELQPVELMEELNILKANNKSIVSEKILASVAAFLINDNLNTEISQRAFDKLLEFPFSPKHLTKEIRNQTLPLEKLVSLIDNLLDRVEPTSSLESVRSLTLLDWITVILDANFKSIILSIDQFKASLINLNEKLNKFCAVYETMENLKSLVELLIHQDFTKPMRFELPVAKVGKYSVDYIQL
ncbi:hypothetical protein HDE_08116 [Halotydeus destructor]|nr:hypothetical protein HDE_08116 [Halotydeus destructor]